MICFANTHNALNRFWQLPGCLCLLGWLVTSASAQQTAQQIQSFPASEAVKPAVGVDSSATAQDTVIVAAGEQYNPLSGFKSSRIAGPVPSSPIQLSPASSELDPVYSPKAIGYTNRPGVVDSSKTVAQMAEFKIYHQPLIQIRMRIAEVVRQDNFTAKTVLDQVRNRGTATNVLGNRAGNRGSVASTRFPNPDTLIGLNNSDYSGGLFNLTTAEMNVLGQILATEFNADVLTCPQVVTLNGQRVELFSGINAPFNLGQSVLQDGTLAVQETFYRQLGTYLTVTPRIVNWGPHGEGQGEAPVRWQHVKDWNALVAMMIMEQLLDAQLANDVRDYVGNQRLLPTDLQTRVLDSLNARSRRDILQLLANRSDPSKPQGDGVYRYPAHVLFHPLDCEPIGENGCPCYWTPSDCTLDLQLILRQSQVSTATIADAARTTQTTRPTVNESAEQVGAAVASVVQIKSGHGAVLAGLIGMRDNELTTKVPILGDMPLVGTLFRSRTTSRQKTEVLIFLEAEVLPAEASAALAESSRDMPLTSPYTNHDVLANPLEASMQRIGIGSYLPPRSLDEKLYWERIGRKVQRSCVATGDVLR